MTGASYGLRPGPERAPADRFEGHRRALLARPVQAPRAEADGDVDPEPELDRTAQRRLPNTRHTHLKYDVVTSALTELTRAADAERSVGFRRPMLSPAGNVVYFTILSIDLAKGSMESIRLDGTRDRVLFDLAFDADRLAFVEDRFALSPRRSGGCPGAPRCRRANPGASACAFR